MKNKWSNLNRTYLKVDAVLDKAVMNSTRPLDYGSICVHSCRTCTYSCAAVEFLSMSSIVPISSSNISWWVVVQLSSSQSMSTPYHDHGYVIVEAEFRNSTSCDCISLLFNIVASYCQYLQSRSHWISCCWLDMSGQLQSVYVEESTYLRSCQWTPHLL